MLHAKSNLKIIKLLSPILFKNWWQKCILKWEISYLRYPEAEPKRKKILLTDDWIIKLYNYTKLSVLQYQDMEDVSIFKICKSKITTEGILCQAINKQNLN